MVYSSIESPREISRSRLRSFKKTAACLSFSEDTSLKLFWMRRMTSTLPIRLNNRMNSATGKNR
ncbi:hypothetical protein EVA_14507 [gut metagenome]|uniref:Uncharacterized protein n=1 Tax=gut metagenome TaxID=749906 RepID=J9GDC5_9ZZZZ